MKIKKYRKIIFLLVTILAVVFLPGCSKPPEISRLAKEDVVVAFGDSITYGTGAARQESYPSVLGDLIGRTVVNAGIPGDVTSGALARLPDILDRENPALVIICIGGNDYLRRLDKKQAADNIRRMVRMTRDRDVAVILIAVPALGFSVSPEPLYREIADDMKVPLEEDILSDILGERSLKSDLIHPNAAGYQKLAEAVAVLLVKTGAIE